MARDPDRLQKLARLVDGARAWNRYAAHQHVKRIRSGAEGEKLWSERTVRDVWALDTVRLDEAERRQNSANSAPRALGVVVIPQRIESAEEWERRRPVTEAVVVPKDEPGD